MIYLPLPQLLLITLSSDDKIAVLFSFNIFPEYLWVEKCLTAWNNSFLSTGRIFNVTDIFHKNFDKYFVLRSFTPTIRPCQYTIHLRIFKLWKSVWKWMRSRRSPRGENHRPGWRFFSYISSFAHLRVQRTMEKRYAQYTILFLFNLIVFSHSLPTSLVEEIKSSELRNNKGMTINFNTFFKIFS